MTDADPGLLRASGITKHFRSQDGWLASVLDGELGSTEPVKAVEGVSFTLHEGETFGLLGESGCGKTTLARTLLRLTEPTGGDAWLEGQSIFEMSAEEVRTELRSRARMIFQHPDAVLNPAFTVSMTLDQALRLHSDLDDEARTDRIHDLLGDVGLSSSHLSKYPSELSGGQKRRVGICRALLTDPDVIVADEPFSGLDISLQERIIELFQEVRSDYDLTMLVISHDTALLRRLCNRIGIMKDGKLVEVLRDGEMTPDHCEHPYAESLLKTHFQFRRRS